MVYPIRNPVETRINYINSLNQDLALSPRQDLYLTKP